jgi:hypothetical protein
MRSAQPMPRKLSVTDLLDLAMLATIPPTVVTFML